MKVLFYGRLAEAIAPEIDIAADGWSIAELRDRLASDHPGAAQVLGNARLRAFVADAPVADDYRLRATDLLELLSPVSGG